MSPETLAGEQGQRREAGGPAAGTTPEVSVILCTYSERRFEELLAAIASIRAQTVPALEVIVVVDHNQALLERLRRHAPDVLAIANTGVRGAGEARNCGVARAAGEVIAFLDDDAIAEPEWIAQAAIELSDPGVLGVGGTIEPDWERHAPRWLAPEFYWTVGCTYAGLPENSAPVRNLIATNMFMRRGAFLELGGFRSGFGKTGARSGTEETELCIRASQRWPKRRWIHDPTVTVRHRVPRARANVRYFLSRCYDEGVAKAAVVRFLGVRDGLSSERAYTRRVLPHGVLSGALASVLGDPAGLARSACILAGLVATSIGYALGSATLGRGQVREAELEPGVEGAAEAAGPRCGGVMVVGSGTHFISGVSHYTRYLTAALADHTPVSVVLMRRLIPRAFYPGRQRVGDETLTEERYPAHIDVYDGVDWYWLPSILGAIRFMRRERPRAVLFQWWTGAVLHTYVALALLARLSGARVLIELHEIQDPGEAGMAPARSYVHRAGGWLMRMADGWLVHSEHDRDALAHSFGICGEGVRVVRHGPFSHYRVSEAEPLRQASAGHVNVLFFGTIRPYKGLEDLVRAFELLGSEDERWWLTVVGETWERWREPTELIAASPLRSRITLVNRYVSDAEASRWFAGADLVALPYRRSSASGPLHLAMDAGLPVVLGEVGGLGEACAGYPGALLVPAGDPGALAEGISRARSLCGIRFQDEGSWRTNAAAVLELVDPEPTVKSAAACASTVAAPSSRARG